MKCPVCFTFNSPTNNAQKQHDEYCVQCGSDLYVHCLLQEVCEEIEGLQKQETQTRKQTLGTQTLGTQTQGIEIPETPETPEISMEEESSDVPKKEQMPHLQDKRSTATFYIASQIIPSMLLIICTVFGIYIGIRFLNFIELSELHRASQSEKWSETGLDQLQQMNAVIKQTLELVKEQRQINQALQATILELAKSKTNLSETSSKQEPTALSPNEPTTLSPGIQGISGIQGI